MLPFEGGYGFFVHATVLPAGTPRAIIGRFVFDGRGSFVNTLTFNDNGRIVQRLMPAPTP
jgi:hypothetical protein